MCSGQHALTTRIHVQLIQYTEKKLGLLPQHKIPSLNVGVTTIQRLNVSDHTYDPSTGVVVLQRTLLMDCLSVAGGVGIATNSLIYTCTMTRMHLRSYPRTTDPAHNARLAIANTTSNTLTVNVGTSTAIPYDVAG